MHIIPPHTSKVTLFHKDGSFQVFQSKAHAKKVLGLKWIREHVGHQFVQYSHSLFYTDSAECLPVYDRCDYILRDDDGKALTVHDFAEPKKFVLWIDRRLANYPGWGPVPHVSKRRGGRAYYRRMGTLNERRLAQTLDEFDIPPRAKRTSNVLPDAWDDYIRSDRADRSWKRYRKHQWK